MFALISYPMGVVAECLILSRIGNTMRVIMPGAADTVELEYKNAEWTTADGVRVELEFVSALSKAEEPQPRYRVLVARSFGA